MLAFEFAPPPPCTSLSHSNAAARFTGQATERDCFCRGYLCRAEYWLIVQRPCPGEGFTRSLRHCYLLEYELTGRGGVLRSVSLQLLLPHPGTGIASALEARPLP